MSYSKRFEQYKTTFEKSYLNVEKTDNQFTPQCIGENVKLLAGISDGSYAVAAISYNKNIKFDLSSTSLIEVKKKITKENNEYETLIFSLMDEELLSIFISFAIDLEGLINSDNEITIVEIYNRYLYWQKMFSQKRNIVTEKTIKGLIHELFILKEFMIPKYGVSQSLKGWGGTEKNHKDFAYSDDMWYEVKAVNFGKQTVRISSIEQLDSKNSGLLIITAFERTSSDDGFGINLINLVNEILNIAEVETDKLDIISRIISMGITMDQLYDEDSNINSYKYLVKDTKHYKVDEKFPKLSRENLPRATGDVSYEIILSEIQAYKTEFL